MMYESYDEKVPPPAERRTEKNVMREERGKTPLYQKLYGGNQPPCSGGRCRDSMLG